MLHRPMAVETPCEELERAHSVSPPIHKKKSAHKVATWLIVGSDEGVRYLRLLQSFTHERLPSRDVYTSAQQSDRNFWFSAVNISSTRRRTGTKAAANVRQRTEALCVAWVGSELPKHRLTGGAPRAILPVT